MYNIYSLLPRGIGDELVTVLVFKCMCLLSFKNSPYPLVTAVEKGSIGRKLKHDVIEAVNELIQDIATCYEQIAEQAVEHIHQKYFSPQLL